MTADNHPDLAVVKDFRDAHGIGYTIEKAEGGFRWAWHEQDITDRPRSIQSTLAAACLEAASDWEDAGSGDNRRAGTLKAAATREWKKALG